MEFLDLMLSILIVNWVGEAGWQGLGLGLKNQQDNQAAGSNSTGHGFGLDL